MEMISLSDVHRDHHQSFDVVIQQKMVFSSHGAYKGF